MDKKISVIVPIYNVEKYLDKCVQSIINQTYRNLEIILVNDGSPDKCGEMIDRYSEIDSRIKVIHKSNGGLSDARNAGLEIATGELIAFVDSDDWIDENSYELMVSYMKDNNADIVVSNISYIYKNYTKEKYQINKMMIFDKEEAMKEIISDGLVQALVWNKLYKKELLDGIKFKVGKLNEDEFFTYKICSKANKIIYIPKSLYKYRQRESSIMSSFSIKRLDVVDALYERMNFVKNEFPNLYSIEKRIFCNACIYNYQMILKNLHVDLDKNGRNKLKQYRKNLKFTIRELLDYGFKQSVYIILSALSINICSKLKNKLSKDSCA